MTYCPLVKFQQMPSFSNIVSEAPGVLIMELMNSECGSGSVEGDEDWDRLRSSHVIFLGVRAACLMW